MQGLRATYPKNASSSTLPAEAVCAIEKDLVKLLELQDSASSAGAGAGEGRNRCRQQEEQEEAPSARKVSEQKKTTAVGTRPKNATICP